MVHLHECLRNGLAFLNAGLSKTTRAEEMNRAEAFVETLPDSCRLDRKS